MHTLISGTGILSEHYKMYTPERDKKEPNILKKEQKESNCINVWQFITLSRGAIIIKSLGKINEKQIQKCYTFL